MLDPYHILDLSPAAGLAEARRAHQKLKNLYAFGTAATEGLLTDQERRVYLERLDQALAAVIAEISPGAAPIAVPQSCASVENAEKPDPATAPGAFLSWTRQQAGLSLRAIAEETKIGISRIEAIEQEDEASFLAPVYLRGFVHNIARALNIKNPQQFADLYLKKFQKPGPDM